MRNLFLPGTGADRWQCPVVWTFFGVLLLLGLALVRDYGISFDEDQSHQNGMVSLKYLAQTFNPDFLLRPEQAAAFERYATPLREFTDRDYGVAFELPVTFIERLLVLDDPRSVYLWRHWCTFLVCWGGVIAVFQLGRRRFADWRWGLLGALLLVLSPRMFAESFYNDKDLVFMAMCAMATNTAVRFLARPTARRALVHALVCALAIDVRIMAVLWPLGTLTMLALRALRGEYPGLRPGRTAALYTVALVGTVVALWPYLWEAPYTNFTTAFANMMHFRWGGTVLFNGKMLPAPDLPWQYAPVWIGITTPLPQLLFMAVGLGAIGWQLLKRRWRLYATDGEWQDLLFVGFGLLPLVAVVALHSVLYDGWRQLYFVYPALLLVALRGVVAVARWRPAPAVGRAWPWLWGGALAASLAGIAGRMVAMHPYQNVYFNALAGPDLAHRYEQDYWGQSALAGLQWIVAHDERIQIRVTGTDNMRPPLRFNRDLLPAFARDRVVMVNTPDEADYFIANYRWHPEDFPYTDEVLRLEPQDSRILSVFRLR